MQTPLAHADRQRQITRVLVVTLVLNLVVASAKLLYGYASGTMSVLADGFHSMMDSTSNIVGLIAIRFASDPPDEEHHYGHRKAEILASMMIAILLAVTCLEIVKELIHRLLSPSQPEVSGWGFVIMLVGLVINLGVVRYESQVGKRLNSQLLLSDAQHTRSDVIVTLSVLISMGAMTQKWYWMDYVVSVGIVAVIGHMAYQLFRQNIDILLDRSPVEREPLLAEISTMTGVRHCHKLRAHGSPDEIFLELHIWVDPTLSVREAHDLAHQVKAQLMRERPELADVTIHVEPDERALPSSLSATDALTKD